MFLNLWITTCRLIVSYLFVQDMFVKLAGITFYSVAISATKAQNGNDIMVL